MTTKHATLLQQHTLLKRSKSATGVLNVRKIVESKGTANVHVFPHQSYPWNPDNFGPVIIPGKGDNC
jgi:signal peptidase I